MTILYQKSRIPRNKKICIDTNFWFTQTDNPFFSLESSAKLAQFGWKWKWYSYLTRFWNIQNFQLKPQIHCLMRLEHNLFKNVSNWATFLWQTQIKTIKYGLNDTKRIKKKQVTCTPSDMNVQTILMPKWFWAKILSQTRLKIL